MFFLDLRVLKMATVYDIGAAAFNVLLTPIKDLRHLEMNGNEKLKAAFVQEVLNLPAFKETLSMEMKMVPFAIGNFERLECELVRRSWSTRTFLPETVDTMRQ